MTVPANSVAKAILDRQPTDSEPVLQHLLYLAQGHHLGWFGVPLFAEPIHATDRGPEVAGLKPAAEAMGNRELNTVGFVLSRYGNLSLRDLGTLIRAQSPYQLADVGRQSGQVATAFVDVDVMRRHFAAANAAERAEMGISEQVIAAHLAGAQERLKEPAQVDDLDALRARFVDHAR